MNFKNRSFLDQDKRKPQHTLTNSKVKPAAEAFESTATMPANTSMFASSSINLQESEVTSANNEIESIENENETQSTDFTGLAGSVLSGFEQAMNIGLSTSTLEVNIIGMLAHASPGSLSGPDIGNLIRTFILSENSNYYTDDVYKNVIDVTADVLGDRFMAWRNSFFLPPTPLYPAFAFFPGPVAPSMSNIPYPAMAAGSSLHLMINSSSIANEIHNRLDQDTKDQISYQELNNMTDVVTQYFDLKVQSQFITNIFGSGVIPSFSPFTPGGPVHGTGIGQPFN